MSTNTLSFGIDRLLADPAPVLGKRIGIVTNPTGFTSDLRWSVVDALASLPGVTIGALFGPEHGVRGEVQDGLQVGNSIDPQTGAPVYSLYGETVRPRPAWLDGLDLIVYDIQDVGCRYYTYLNTLAFMMEAAAEKGIPVLVLDRPDPINGIDIDGPLLQPGVRSFVGNYPVPVRYALTIGEFARYLKDTAIPACDVRVVTCGNWRRHEYYDETNLPWMTPSPNLPTIDCAVIYPGMCLFEGTNLSEGRGTTHPFEWVGAPWLDAEGIARELNRRDLPAARFRPVYFEPLYSKHKGVRCAGLQIHVTDRSRFRAFTSGLHVLDAILRRHPGEFKFLESSWEGHRPHFDLLTGDPRIRESLLAGTPVREMEGLWADELRAWGKLRRNWVLPAA
ncbi:MAG: DUF1343 domain-containing protein [Thermoflexales bacterium]|nr:DUF1343 domain-containing protein [Thermoflexales bacterium]